MSRNNKVCVELAFDKDVSKNQRMKVKSFWKYIDETKPLEPYTVEPEKAVVITTDDKIPKCNRPWYNQFKALKEYGLDKVALAAAKNCPLCSNQYDSGCSVFDRAQEESYEEQLADLKAFDEKLEELVKEN